MVRLQPAIIVVPERVRLTRSCNITLRTTDTATKFRLALPMAICNRLVSHGIPQRCDQFVPASPAVCPWSWLGPPLAPPGPSAHGSRLT